MTDARIEYEVDEQGRVRPSIIGGNGEVQARLEWYDSRSNAERGVSDLFTTLAATISVVRETPTDDNGTAA